MYLVIASGPTCDVPIAAFSYEDAAIRRAEKILEDGYMSIHEHISAYFHELDRPAESPCGILVMRVHHGIYRRVLCESLDSQPDPNAAKLATALTANYCPQCGSFTRGGACCDE